MAGWKLEVFKMCLYMSFPVGLFYYFNQPGNFEKVMMEKRKAFMNEITPENEARLKKTMNQIEEYREKRMKEQMKST